MVGLGLQQYRIHVRMTRHTSSLCLHSLGPANLKSIRSGIGVERHVLRLERSRMIAILTEYATEGSGYDALTHIAACTNKHDRMQPPVATHSLASFFHKYVYNLLIRSYT